MKIFFVIFSSYCYAVNDKKIRKKVFFDFLEFLMLRMRETFSDANQIFKRLLQEGKNVSNQV